MILYSFMLISTVMLIIIMGIKTIQAKKTYLFCSWLLIQLTAMSFFIHIILFNTIFFLSLCYIFVGLFDLNSNHNILRNYPVIGHIRFLFEFIRPEIQQYFIATNQSGRPYPREIRSLIYRRAKNIDDTHPFGTQMDIDQPGHWYAMHSLNVKKVKTQTLRHWIGNEQCHYPYHASIINISAMSYGSLGPTAIQALNMGAQKANMYHNTGEGGISDHHRHGGDLVWQIGTGNFGCRTKDGNFCADTFKEKAADPAVKMIELKLSQGAKPAHGGILPAAKITPEIAHIRGIHQGQDCLSPPTHPAFNTPLEMMHFLKHLRELSGGKPVGFKLAIGNKEEFYSICHAILKTNIYPDFITVDGAEGGTGAAPLIFSNHLAMPGLEAVRFVHNTLMGCGIKQHITLIASAKIVSGFDVIKYLAAGADTVNMARPFLFTLGCIQAIHCNTNACPTGVATTDPRRYQALQPQKKYIRVANFHDRTIHACAELLGAMGCQSPKDLRPDMILYRVEHNQHVNLANLYGNIEHNAFKLHPDQFPDYHQQSSEQF